jgi:hypothetical protein
MRNDNTEKPCAGKSHTGICEETVGKLDRPVLILAKEGENTVPLKKQIEVIREVLVECLQMDYDFWTRRKE